MINFNINFAVTSDSVNGIAERAATVVQEAGLDPHDESVEIDLDLEPVFDQQDVLSPVCAWTAQIWVRQYRYGSVASIPGHLEETEP